LEYKIPRESIFCPFCVPPNGGGWVMLFEIAPAEQLDLPPQERVTTAGEPVWNLTCGHCGFHYLFLIEDAKRMGWM
jgi:hypothetical protein